LATVTGESIMALRTILFAAFLLLWTAAESRAAPPGSDQEFVTRVNRSIERGVALLKQREAGKGNWEDTVLASLSDQVGGQTALVTLALLNCGVSADDKVVQRALEFLRGLEPKKTYVVGLSTMVFAEARQDKDLQRIKRNADWLIANAVYEKGEIRGWSYPMNPIPDGSNTQYALLGLYAAKQAGVKIEDKHWQGIRDLYTSTQRDEKPNGGYWTYDYTRPSGGGSLSGPSFTMTTAGVCGLLIAGMGLNESQQQLDVATGVAAKCGLYETNGQVAKGMNWIASRFSFESVPGLKSTYYNIYGIERLGRLSGQRFIGKYDWYREGCEYLVRVQNDDGTWSRQDKLADRISNVATSFALLFLSKGKTPVLLTKLAYGQGRDGENGIVGWNRKQSDVRHLTEFASRELFNGLPMAWQIYDTRKLDFTPDETKSEVETLLASPIVYFNGHDRPVLTGKQKEILKKYVDEGGFLFAEACCGDVEFTNGFRELMRELFPENKLERMPPEHSVWRSFYNVSPADFPGIECLDRGCKTVVVLCTKPVAGYWEENKYMIAKGKAAANRGERAYQLAGNVIAYATGMQPPEQRGSKVKIADGKLELNPPRGAFKPAQLRLRDEAPPAPAAMRNLMAHVQEATGLQVIQDKQAIGPADAELGKFKFVYMHGRKRFDMTEAELENVKMTLETGGLLFADSCCGKREFDESFRAYAKKLFPDSKLERIPTDDFLYSKKLNGTEIRTVKRREKADGVGPDGGYLDLPPLLEGIKIDGRWVVIYSPFDIGCALERHKSTDCLGYNPESALQLGTAAVLYSLKR